jgi:hypothetical protein
MDIDKRIENMEKNSMFYWYPKIKNLDIPQPKTEMYKFTKDEFKTLQRTEGIPTTLYDNCISFAEKIGFPLFMRTDNSSCKHGWLKTCYVESKESFKNHIFELLSNSVMQGWMSYVDKGLIFRELLELEIGHRYGIPFTAFYGEFPVNKERRYFIRDGKLQCRHPYWYPDAIRNPSYNDWKDTLEVLNKETSDEVLLLTKYAQKVADIFDGYWSVDFAKCFDDNWYLIDMAIGDDSFHWLECDYCSEEMRKQYKES